MWRVWFALAGFVLLLVFLLLIVLSLFFNFYLFVLLRCNLVWLRIGVVYCIACAGLFCRRCRQVCCIAVWAVPGLGLICCLCLCLLLVLVLWPLICASCELCGVELCGSV